jgi:uncharacterized protein
MFVIDSDTHIAEPADLWTSRIKSTTSGEYIPEVRFNEAKNREEWYIGEHFVSLAPAGAVAGYSEPFPASPRNFGEAHPASYDLSARLELMEEEGIWAQVLYPNVSGFAGGQFLKIPDVGLRNECVRAYNDFLVEWTAPALGRFVSVCAIPFWDIDDSVEEIKRAHGCGHRAVLMCGKPDNWWDQPTLSDPIWDPIWETAQRLGMSISVHAGGGDPLNELQRGYKGMPLRTRLAANASGALLGGATTITDLIFGGVLERFPDLKWVLVESGIGWIPFVLESMDHQFDQNNVRKASPELQLLPSEYFRRQMYVTYWFEEMGPRLLLEEIGVNNVMFETDFPHPTCLWPPVAAREQAAKSVIGLPVDVQERVLWRNAAELYGLTPEPEAVPEAV